jgi:hypothetical protein
MESEDQLSEIAVPCPPVSTPQGILPRSVETQLILAAMRGHINLINPLPYPQPCFSGRWSG